MREESRRLIRWLIKAGVSVGLVLVLLWHADLGRLGQTLTELELGWLLVAVVIKGLGILAGVLRWRLLLSGQDLNLAISSLAGAYLVGRFFGSFLPSTIGLDAYRTYYAAVRTRQVARCLTVTLVEKVIGLLALSLLALIALPLGVRLLPPKALWPLGAVICAPMIAAGLLLFYPGLFERLALALRRRGKRFSQAMARMSGAVARFGAQPGRILLALLLGFVVHGATCCMYVATARSVGVQIPAAEILFVGPLMIAATLVPLSIAGIGVREGTFVFFLTRIGVLPEQAALLGFLGFLAGELYSLAGGALWALQPAARPEQNHRLTEVVSRVATWARGGAVAPTKEVGE